MDQLFKVKNSVFYYFSPAKRQRQSAMNPTTPTSRVQSQTQIRPLNGPMTEPKDAQTKAVLKGRVSKKYLSPGDTKQIIRRVKKVKDDEDYRSEESSGSEADFVDATGDAATPSKASTTSVKNPTPLNEKSPTVIKLPSARFTRSVEDKSSQKLKKRASSVGDDGELNEEERKFEDRNAEQLASEARAVILISRQANLEKNRTFLDEIRREGWHADEVELMERLAMRNFEPLMHVSWSRDLRTLPQILFTNNDEETFINSISGNEFRAIMALESLISLGGRVRALIAVRSPTEKVMEREIRNYIRWSEGDADYSNKKSLRCITVFAAPTYYNNTAGKAKAKIFADKIGRGMHRLAERHRKALLLPEPHHINEMGEKELYRRPPPVIFGIVTQRTRIIFFSLDSSLAGDAAPRALQVFDLADYGADVWIALAVALLCITARNEVLEHVEELEDSDDSIVDVDA